MRACLPLMAVSSRWTSAWVSTVGGLGCRLLRTGAGKFLRFRSYKPTRVASLLLELATSESVRPRCRALKATFANVPDPLSMACENIERLTGAAQIRTGMA